MYGGFGGGGASGATDAYGAFNTNKARFPSSGKNDEYTTPQRRAALEKAEIWARDVAARAKEQDRLKAEAKAAGASGRKMSLGLGRRGKGYERMGDEVPAAGRAERVKGLERTPAVERMETVTKGNVQQDEAVDRGLSATAKGDPGAPEIMADAGKRNWVKRIFK